MGSSITVGSSDSAAPAPAQHQLLAQLLAQLLLLLQLLAPAPAPAPAPAGSSGY